jgi:hypothetical protein
MKTLNGYTLAEAVKMLDAELSPFPNAYKPIRGGKGETLGLTDINPGFLPPTFSAAFGPCGIGWGYEIDSLEWLPETKDSKGRPVYEAQAQVSMWVAYLTDAGGLVQGARCAGVGASDNSERGWAAKGAITNALGHAAFMLGYQVSVFKGMRSHKGGSKPDPKLEHDADPDPERSKAMKALHAAGATVGLDHNAVADRARRVTGIDFQSMSELTIPELRKVYADIKEKGK